MDVDRCPFCAGYATPVNVRDGWQVRCLKCGASGPDASHGPADGLSATAWAIAVWNRRAAVQALAVPEGWKLVPVEPTPEMLEPLARAWCKEHGINPDDPQPPHGEYPRWYEQCGPYAEMYRAMLAAVPQEPRE